MSRRSGQSGRIEQRGKTYYVRFWLDVPGREKRVYKAVRICPAVGPGKLNRFELKRRAKEIIGEFGANSEKVFRAAEAVNLGTPFKEQAERWLKDVQARKRKPIKPHTASTWSSYLRWINEQIGELPLSSVDNLTVKELIARMASEVKKGRPRFSSKSIANYVQVIEMVVASAVDERGEAIYPVKWNHDFMDLPEIHNQRKPTFTAAEIETIIASADGQERLLYALLAGTGLRVGEALALRVEAISGSVLSVREGLWNSTLQTPKTTNGIREVDLSSRLVELVEDHLDGRQSGFLFRTAAGTTLAQSNVLRRSLHVILDEMKRVKCGFHAFRRFRAAHLRKHRIPEDMIRFWLGHAPDSLTSEYAAQLRQDRPFRSELCEKVGLGFTIVDRLAPVAPKMEVARFSASA